MGRISDKDFAAITSQYSGSANLTSSGGDDSVFKRSALNVGDKVLKALTVPESAVSTAWFKVNRAMPRIPFVNAIPGMDGSIPDTLRQRGDISWKSALGDFYTSKGGKQGQTNASSAVLGTDNPWANIVYQIATDPLWFVSAGSVNAAAKAKQVSKIADIMSYAQSAGKTAKAAKTGLTAKRRAQLAKALTMTEPRARQIALARALSPSLKKLGKIKPLSATTGDGTLSKLDAVIARVRAEAPLAPAGDVISDAGKFANPVKFKEMVQARRAADIARLGTKRKGYMYLGTAKNHLRVTPYVTYNRKGLAAVKAGMLSLKPAEKSAHALRRIMNESIDRTDLNVLALAAKHGLAAPDEKGLLRLHEGPAQLLGVYRQLRSIAPDAAARVREQLVASGRWTQGMDDLSRFMDEHYTAMRRVQYPQASTIRYAEGLRKELVRETRRAEKVGGVPSKKLLKLRMKIANLDAETSGLYEPRGKSFAQQAAQTTARRDRLRAGFSAPSYSAIDLSRDLSAKELDTMRNPFSLVNRDHFIGSLREIGLSDREAHKLWSTIDSGLVDAGEDGFAQVEKMADDALIPEFNALLTMGRRENEFFRAQVDAEIGNLTEQVIREIDLEHPGMIVNGEQPSVVRAIQTGVNPHAAGRLGEFEPVRVLTEKVIPYMKSLFTTLNVGPHFMSNAFGDFKEGLINGNWRHATRGAAASVPRTKMWNIASGTMRHEEGAVKLSDRALAALDEVYTIGGKQYTGWDLDMLARMVGLGRGYHTADIGNMLHMFGVGADSGKGLLGKATRLQVRRENAQRLTTWINHMHAGDDPITASVKTLRVHFDYNELTDIEKLLLRNVLLFYTWMKRNAVLQASAVVTRPAVPAASYRAGFSRPEIPNEPDYYKEQGAWGIPGVSRGVSVIGDPYLDIYKFEASWQSFRKNVIAAGNPLLRAPVEVALNRSAFTGGEISKYEGQNTPSLLARTLDAVGVDVPQSRTHTGGVRQPALPAWANYLVGAVQGPQAAGVQQQTDPEFEGSKLEDLVGRITGVRVQQNQPKKFAHAKKVIEANRKADATRKRNAEKP